MLSRDHKPNDDIEKGWITKHGGKTLPYASGPSSVSEHFYDISDKNCNAAFQRWHSNMAVGGMVNPTQLLFGPYRMMPGGLSVSRTFGDIEAKLSKIWWNPEISKGKNPHKPREPDFTQSQLHMKYDLDSHPCPDMSIPEIKQFRIKEDHHFILLA